MHPLKIKKGFRFRILGQPGNDVAVLSDPEQVALLPEWIPHVKPRLLVKEGDAVRIGSPLLEDKRNPRVRFLSPGGGRISRIQFGPRRVIQAIVIDRHTADEPRERFEKMTAAAIDGMAPADLTEQILKGGLWWVFRELPFRDLPHPDRKAPLIIVALDDREPFSASPALYLRNRTDMFAYGMKVLRKLSDNRVWVTADASQPRIADQITDLIGDEVTHWIGGDYPAGDPGTVLYHLKKTAAENRAWYIAGQDLLLLAQLLAEGQYPTERLMAVGGSAAPARRHVRTRIGVPVAALLENRLPDKNVRYVAGGLLRGFESSFEGFTGLYETSLNIVPRGDTADFLALFNPGPDRPTYSRLFLSRLNPKPVVYTCNQGGEARACIACMHCVDVCPVDILPQMTYKAILAEEPEEYLAHGLLDCVECGLCTYVCPSKIELTRTFRATKAAYAKDRPA